MFQLKALSYCSQSWHSIRVHSSLVTGYQGYLGGGQSLFVNSCFSQAEFKFMSGGFKSTNILVEHNG